MAFEIEFSEDDKEVIALRSNAAFMAFLTECERRTASGKRITLKEIRATFESDANPTEEIL